MDRLQTAASDAEANRGIPHWVRDTKGVAFTDLPTRRGGRLPDFYIIGAAKAGTTAVNDYLCQHPQIHMCPLKEPHFFSTDLIYECGLDWYMGLYADATPGQLCGEALTSYTRWPSTSLTPRRIHEATPDAKLIYLVREPVSRVESECLQFLKYNKYIMNDSHPPSSVDACLEYILEEKGAPAISPITTSEYITQIEKYLEYFGPERILVLLHDDIRKRPGEKLKAIAEFLGVDPGAPIDLDRKLNVTDDFKDGLRRERLAAICDKIPGFLLAKRLLPRPFKEAAAKTAVRVLSIDEGIQPMSEETRRGLAAHFKPYNERLADYLGRDLSGWDV